MGVTMGRKGNALIRNSGPAPGTKTIPPALKSESNGTTLLAPAGIGSEKQEG